MTTQAMAAVATAMSRRSRQGQPEVGRPDPAHRRGLVLLYLFLPIFVIVLFSFNKPAGQVQLHLAGLHAGQLGRPVQVPGADQRAEAEPQHRRRVHR